MNKGRLSCRQANEMDLVNYLATLGFRPSKVRNYEYWYLSPLREEKTPSFKVNSKTNFWYDFGIAEGGGLIDFCMLYFNCSIKDILNRLVTENPSNFSIPFTPAFKRKEIERPIEKIVIKDVRSISAQSLIQYLEKRCIPLEIAKRYCMEVDFMLYGKTHRALGFKNRDGGYELRNEYFKGSSSPKNITLFGNSCYNRINVFEGFFDFLSFQTQKLKNKKSINGKLRGKNNFLVLNSLSFFEKNRSLLEKYEQIHLYLDNDPAGNLFVQKALGWSNRYMDRRELYSNCKDLNEHLATESLAQEH